MVMTLIDSQLHYYGHLKMLRQGKQPDEENLV